MKLRVFQSGSGDCLLLTGDGPKEPNVLVDGDKLGAYRDYVAPFLNDLHKAGKKLNLVYVSHIDNDHIEGVLQLLDDLVEWRIFNFKTDNGKHPEKHPKPPSLEPPEIDMIWHNAFHDLFGIDSGQVEELLTARTTILGNVALDDGTGPMDTGVAATQRLVSLEENLATGLLQAIRVSYRASPRQLDIALNPPAFNGGLMQVTTGTTAPAPIDLEGMSFSLLGPFEEDVVKLREDWKKWLAKKKPEVEELARNARESIQDLHGDEVDLVTQSALVQATALHRRLVDEVSVRQAVTEVSQLGERDKVTTPNLASIMVLVEEGGKKVLLTGDGHADDIIKGLAHHGKLDANNSLHVNVLKIQHHGAEFNINTNFCDHITADHYIFCSNGLHENPHPLVLQAIVESRDKPGDVEDFTFWFNTPEPPAAEQDDEKGYTKHMRTISKRVRGLAAGMNGRMKIEFRGESSFEIPF
jgi:beta-lactamase superfamily II metal-dependent hydrolase